MTVDVATLVDVLGVEGPRLLDAVERAGPDAPVATCPEWTVRDVVLHAGGVHRWAARIVGEPLTEPYGGDLEELVGGWPGDEDLVPWFRAGHALVSDALRSAPADLECWAFLRAASPLTMWARRQAHETTVHRVDIELVSGEVSPIVATFAADGIDELLTGFLPRRSSRLRTETTRRIGVQATDTGDAWTVTTGADGPPRTERAGGDADVVVRAPAADLYLLLWNRRGADGVVLEGDASLLDAWRRDVTVRWS